MTKVCSNIIGSKYRLHKIAQDYKKMLSPRGFQVPDSSSDAWGILYPINCDLYKVFHMKNNEAYYVGRDSDCQYQLRAKPGFKKSEELKLLFSNISKKHFKIYKENDDTSSRGYSVILEDLSMNGTYVDGFHVGQGCKHTLVNTSKISLARKDNEAFIFVDGKVNTSGEDTSEVNELKRQFKEDSKNCEVSMKRKCGY